MGVGCILALRPRGWSHLTVLLINFFTIIMIIILIIDKIIIDIFYDDFFGRPGGHLGSS